MPLYHYPPSFDLDKHSPLTYYISLESPIVKGLQIKVGDCVYIYRQSSSPLPLKNMAVSKKNGTVSNETNFLESLNNAAKAALSNLNHPFERRECIIIRVQYLAIVEATQQRILYGHHYLWPSETYHEPSRKFYTNEVLRSPLCEWAAIEEVRNICSVLDPITYMKGRPKGFDPEDVFINDLRVDRAAKSFSRITRQSHYTVCMKSYAFEMYETKLNIKRTYSVCYVCIF